MTDQHKALRLLQLMDLRCKIAYDQRFRASTQARAAFWDHRWWMALRGWSRAILLKTGMS